MMMSIDAEKAFCKIEYPFTIKTHSKLGIQKNFFHTIKDIYKNSTVNIILNDERLKPFPLISHTRQGCPLQPLLFNIMLKVLINAISQEKEKKVYRLGRKNKTVLLKNDMIIYVENSKELIKIS